MTEMAYRSHRTLRTTLLAVGIVLLATYLLLFDSTAQFSEEDFTVDERELEEELENSHKVQYVTYKPPKADSFDKEVDEILEKTSHRKRENEAESFYRRTMKYHKIWAYANKAINIHEFFADTPDVDTVLEAMATARIVSVDHLDESNMGEHEVGTAEKWVAILEGGQKVMIKLMWEEQGKMKQNALCNYGYEMPSGEIAAFHLHRVLGFRNTPYVTGRYIDIYKEILPVASPSVAAQIAVKGNQTCVTGKCYFCKKSTTLCPPNNRIAASLAYWVPRKLKLYTFPPKYMPFSTPRIDEWGKVGFNDKKFCNKVRKEHPYDIDRYYHDLFDFSVIDSLMYHYDSKHYLIQDNSDARGLTVRLDHGRAFCAHDRDEEKVFLAPIKQCCILRSDTWWSLDSFRNGLLTRRLKQELAKDPIAPIFKDEEFYKAIERRLSKLIELLERCASANNGWNNVLVG